MSETKKQQSGADTPPIASIKSYRQNYQTHSRIPAKGRDREDILREMEEMRAVEEGRWERGYASGCVYHGGQEPTDFLNKEDALIASVDLGRLSFDDIPDRTGFAATYQPNPDNRAIYDEMFGEFLSIYKNNKQMYARLNGTRGR